jgi:hypothetical protein
MSDAQTAWRTRIVDHADVPPADLVPNPWNWRTHPAEQRRALGGALSEVGWVTGVVVNRTTGNIVDGTCGSSSPSPGTPSVPVTYVDLTADEEALVLATFDPIGAMATAEAVEVARM